MGHGASACWPGWVGQRIATIATLKGLLLLGFFSFHPTEGLADSVASDCPRAPGDVGAPTQPPTPFDTPVTVPAPTPFQNIMGGLGVTWGKDQSIAAQDAAALEKDRLAKRERWLKLNRTTHWSDRYCDVRTNYLQFMILGRTSETNRKTIAHIESKRTACLAWVRGQIAWDFNSAEVQDAIANLRENGLRLLVKREGDAKGTTNFFVQAIGILRALEQVAYFQAEEPCNEQAVRAYLTQFPAAQSSPIPRDIAGSSKEEHQQSLESSYSPAKAPALRQDQPVIEAPALNTGRPVYETSECIGPVIMGECKGSILPNKAYHQKCYGQWLNGQCTGPMF